MTIGFPERLTIVGFIAALAFLVFECFGVVLERERWAKVGVLGLLSGAGLFVAGLTLRLILVAVS